MFKEFEMTDCGIMSIFLRIEVKQQQDGISISQRKYAKELLEKFRMSNCNAVRMPVAIGLRLTKEGEGRDINLTLFKSLTGSLRYLTITRINIVYGVKLLSRYMERPKESHWFTAKIVLWYIKGIIDLGLFYSYSNEAKLYGYSDSDWGVAQPFRASLSFFFIKSTTSTRRSSCYDAFHFLNQRRRVAALVFINSRYLDPVFIDTARRSLRKKRRLETRIFSIRLV
ncbi:hypothetical protein MRB53_023022 [Persea americana]|uniref:Uncharacterized protein n=1 Tax=Persea americana TaxID=3435 RepID=A0ACC2L9I4_PERAE|nr:hypothetical protein MRB53_023022 [Persea americana]